MCECVMLGTKHFKEVKLKMVQPQHVQYLCKTHLKGKQSKCRNRRNKATVQWEVIFRKLDLTVITIRLYKVSGERKSHDTEIE